MPTTIRDRVRAGLRAHGPCDRNQLAQHLGLAPGQVSPVLTWLGQSGEARRSPTGTWSSVAATMPAPAPEPALPGEEVDELARLRRRLADLEEEAKGAEAAWLELTSEITGEGPTDLMDAISTVRDLHARAGRWDMLSGLARSLVGLEP